MTMTLIGSTEDISFVDASSVTCVNKGLNIRNNGHGNKIVVGKGVVFNGFSIQIDCNNSTVIIGDECRLTGTVIMKLSDDNHLTIGAKTSIGGASFICCESSHISIGDDCMIAWGIEFRTTDSHAIFDRDTNQRINNAQNIIIGNHVWVGAHTTILKGTKIQDGSVVAIRSLVNKEFVNQNVVIGGVPAKEIKSNIRWERPLLG